MLKTRPALYLCVLVVILDVSGAEENEESKIDHRDKRQVNSLPLVYPYGGTYKLLIGMAAPVPIQDDQLSLLFAINFQYQYLQFQNISQLSTYYFIKEVSREERETDLLARRDERLIFYKSVSDLLKMKDMNGQDCILRAICEAAQYPVQDEALVGELLHILLTPDYGHTPFEDKDPDWVEAISIYQDAATAGRQMFDCGHIYDCPQGESVLDLITTLRDE